MSKIVALVPVVGSHCIRASQWCAIIAGLAVASVGLNWGMDYLFN